jgi:hypothetical protein
MIHITETGETFKLQNQMGSTKNHQPKSTYFTSHRKSPLTLPDPRLAQPELISGHQSSTHGGSG